VSQDITEEPVREPAAVVFMDPAKTIVELIEDEDGLLLTLTDDDARIHFRLPWTAAAGGLVRRLGWDIVNVVPDVRAQTLGYRAEHNAHTGPGVRGPVER
jgi:hypothetical protein